MSDTIPQLSPDALRTLAACYVARADCPCGVLRCPGWESLSATFDETLLRRVGRTGGDDPYEEPTYEEHHPGGTRYDSPCAPITLDHFPYNRCDVWQCVLCARVFLRYTEYGGYYVDRRIRELDPALLLDWAYLLRKE